MDRAQESSKQLRINNTISSCIKQALTGRLFFLAVAGIVFALGIGGFADFWKAACDYRGAYCLWHSSYGAAECHKV